MGLNLIFQQFVDDAECLFVGGGLEISLKKIIFVEDI